MLFITLFKFWYNQQDRYTQCQLLITSDKLYVVMYVYGMCVCVRACVCI
jgi:hypothetical protein